MKRDRKMIFIFKCEPILWSALASLIFLPSAGAGFVIPSKDVCTSGTIRITAQGKLPLLSCYDVVKSGDSATASATAKSGLYTLKGNGPLSPLLVKKYSTNSSLKSCIDRCYKAPVAKTTPKKSTVSSSAPKNLGAGNNFAKAGEPAVDVDAEPDTKNQSTVPVAAPGVKAVESGTSKNTPTATIPKSREKQTWNLAAHEVPLPTSLNGKSPGLSKVSEVVPTTATTPSNTLVEHTDKYGNPYLIERDLTAKSIIGPKYYVTTKNDSQPHLYNSIEHAQTAARGEGTNITVKAEDGSSLGVYDADGNAAADNSEGSTDYKGDAIARFKQREADAKEKKLAEDAVPGGKKKKKRKEEKSAEEKAELDSCSESQLLALKMGGKRDFRCDPTNRITQGVTAGNEILQTGGAAMINKLGTNVANGTFNGSASSLQKGAAKAATVARNYETSITAVNATAALLLNARAKKHRQNAADIKSLQKEMGAMAPKRNLQNAHLSNTEVFENFKQDQDEITKALKQQNTAQKTASVATFAAALNAMKSGQNALSAEAARNTAQDRAKFEAAQEKAVRDNTLVWNPGSFASTGGTPNGDGTGSGNDENTSISDNSTDKDGGDLLPNGNDVGAGSLDGPNSPKAAAFKAGSGSGGAAGGAGGGSLGAGSSGGGGGGGNDEAAKAAYASEFGTKERYESGGGGVGGGAGKAGGKLGGNDDGGIDLNGLLAQFLPKAEEEMPNKNGILDFAAGGGARRMPANEDAPSFLDKNADLFQRIHETMSEKNRKGQVGS